MGIKILKSLIQPYLKVNTIILILFAAVLFYFNITVGIFAFLIVMILFWYYQRLSVSKKELLVEYAKAITDDMEETTRHFISKNPLPLCMIDYAGEILWINKKFSEIYEDVEMFHTNIHQITNVKHTEFLNNEDEDKYMLVSHGGKTYRVMASSMRSKEGEQHEENNTTMLYWLDITNLETLKNLYKDEKLCTAYVNVDNYDDLIASSPDERKAVIAAQIEKTIRQWAAKINASVTRYRAGQYHIALEYKHFEKLEINKFSILDEVREIETDADFPASLSIGIGVGAKTPQQLDEYAAAALDLALGRGGDQAVVKKMSKVEYYGGRLQAVEKRNKGKSKIMAHALRQLIDQSPNVVIMGHKKPDMDCFGAALGVFRIAKNRNKEAIIVINDYHESLENIYNRAKESENYRFENSETVLGLVEKDTLLIVLDTHKPSLVECPELLYKTDKIVVIDHHRKAEESIENPTLTYMESYASSTSELITEILQYIGDKKEVDKLEAEALLAGITVDTKSFSVKTGVRTFEAASWLRRSGADTASVRQFFKTDLQFFKRKSVLISDAQVLENGIALTYTEEPASNMQILASQAADQLLDINGIRASFAAGPTNEGYTAVSGRSLGEINVQTILEKIGGGGHLTTAGAQLEMTPKEAIEKLKQLISEANIQ